MARAGLRTTVVVWLRVLLPLAALAVLSTLFLFSRQPWGDGSQPESAVPTAEPRITAPSWTGVTGDGTRLTAAARSAIFDASGRIETAQGVYLHWQAPDGVEATLAAPTGQMAGDMISLDGGVSVAVSGGWHMTAPRMDVATDRSWMAASGGVAVDAPFGEIESDRALIRPVDPDRDDGQLLDFTGDVRLIYRP